MTHEKSDITIPNPCDVPWDEMHDQGTSRFCDNCTTDVHDLSQFTREEAYALIEHGGDHVCVRYAELDGEIFFKDSTAPIWRLARQLEGAKKLLAAAALIVPMLAACEPSQQPDPQPEAVEPATVAPISIDAGGASIKPGAGIAPTFGTQPETTPPEVVIDHPVGKVAPEPREPKPPTPIKTKPKDKDPHEHKVGRVIMGKPARHDTESIHNKVGRPNMVKGKVKIGKPTFRPRPDGNVPDRLD